MFELANWGNKMSVYTSAADLLKLAEEIDRIRFEGKITEVKGVWNKYESDCLAQELNAAIYPVILKHRAAIVAKAHALIRHLLPPEEPAHE